MTINAKQLTFILDNTPAEQNIMLVGKHGIGKSRILEDYFNKKGAKVVTLFLGQMSDPGDLIGLPEKNQKTGKTDFMLPYWFPVDGESIVLFLDELNRARPEVLQTIMDLTLNRKLAGKTLPAGSRIISAVNNGSEYQLTDLDPALVSRFNIYEFAPTVDDWLQWGHSSNVDERILTFINQNPEYLDEEENDFAEENLERKADRRSWERASNIIKNFSKIGEEEKILLSGIIGNKATALFCKFLNENKVLSAKQILENDFNKDVEKFKNLSISEYTQFNDSVFRYLESKTYSEDKKLCAVISKNLLSYYNYIEENDMKEYVSHFISLCNSEKYPETLCFIMENCPELYEKIMAFVVNI